MAKTYHEKLTDKVSDFIRRIHADRSVSPEQTIETLERLSDEILECVTAIEEDIEREEL